ncbi:hypothetical protein ACFO5R_02860 [Halosolutus amylolyticus]|uniref:Uncharacterized protein n=1 Tax=Halosolutus amylolyticus TaxID=2932267 RepID=A0ABD5PJW5_9EURY|nr:hypothetical protein [Halosolutus amylolyticus]
MVPGIRRAVSEIRENYDSIDWWRNRVFVPYVVGTLTRLHPAYPGYDEAVRVMDEDWDTLVVLDACRADFFETVADVEMFDEYRRVVSLGSHSSEWMRRNFGEREFGDTVYVSANPHTALVAGDCFHEVVELWEREFDDEAGVVLPETVVDAAIAANEEYPHKRLIVHFMQPHGPFVGSDVDDPSENEAAHWRAYTENLEYGLSYALDLSRTLPGRSVITADHGRLYSTGLKRSLGLYAHKARLRFPELVVVPWAAIDGERRTISTGETSEATGVRVEERLRQLGYR